MGPQPTTRRLLLCLLLLIVVGQCIRALTFEHRGLEGKGRAEQLRAHDYRYVYVAGRCWLQGKTPHVYTTFKEVWESELGSRQDLPFAYPPTLAVVSVPVASLGWNLSCYLFDALNIASYCAILVYLARIARLFGKPPGSIRVLVALAISAAGASINGVLFAGQTSVLVTLGVTATVYHTLRKQTWTAATWMVIASIKPHLSLLPFLMLCAKEPSLLWRCVVTVGLACLASLLLGGDLHALAGMFGSLAMHSKTPFNLPGNLTIFHRLFGPGPVEWAAPIAAVFLTLLLACRSRSDMTTVLGVPMILSTLLLPIHTYDFCILMFPIFVGIVFHWNWLLLPAIVLITRSQLVEVPLHRLGLSVTETGVLALQSMALLVMTPFLVFARGRNMAITGLQGPPQVGAQRGESASEG